MEHEEGLQAMKSCFIKSTGTVLPMETNYKQDIGEQCVEKQPYRLGLNAGVGCTLGPTVCIAGSLIVEIVQTHKCSRCLFVQNSINFFNFTIA